MSKVEKNRSTRNTVNLALNQNGRHAVAIMRECVLNSNFKSM